MESSFLAALSVGSLLGLSSGLTPGPLSVLISQFTLNKNYRAATKICFAPLVADIPIIALSLAFLGINQDNNRVLSSLALIGGLYLAYIAVHNFQDQQSNSSNLHSRAFFKTPFLMALKTILSNPTVYLFWMSIGTPYILKSAQDSWVRLCLFLGTFYLGLIGSKMLYFLLAKQLSEKSSPIWIKRSLKLLSVLLFFFAAERILYALKSF